MNKSGKVIFELILGFAIWFVICYILKINNVKENYSKKITLATQNSSLIAEATEKGKNTNIIYEIKEEEDKLVVRTSLDGNKSDLKGAVEIIETYTFEKENNKVDKKIIFDSIYSADMQLSRTPNKYSKADLNELYIYEESITEDKNEILEVIYEDCEVNNLYCKIIK